MYNYYYTIRRPIKGLQKQIVGQLLESPTGLSITEIRAIVAPEKSRENIARAVTELCRKRVVITDGETYNGQYIYKIDQSKIIKMGV